MHQVKARPRWSRRFGWSGPALAATVAALSLAACGSSSSSSSSSSSAAATSPSAGTGSSWSAAAGGGSLKKGLKVFVIPKNLGNNYFTVADSVKTGGALAAIGTLGETGQETSGSAATSASELPAIQAAIARAPTR